MLAYVPPTPGNQGTICTNYLGDPGGSPAFNTTNSFSVDVPANQTLVVVVQEANLGQAAGSTYTVQVSGLVGNGVGPGPCPPTSNLTALGPAQVWIGLKNSDDVGTRFDLLAEALKNGTVIGSGQVNGVSGGSSGFNNAILDTINMALPSPVTFQSGDTLSFRLSVRVAATGHRSGTARLWFNDAEANSRFSATVNATTSNYFLLNGFGLGSAAGPGPKKTIDVFVDRQGGNPFKPFGTWNKTF